MAYETPKDGLQRSIRKYEVTAETRDNEQIHHDGGVVRQLVSKDTKNAFID